MGLEAELSIIRELQSGLADLDTERNAISSDSLARMDDLRHKIANGESTGDDVTDFSLFVHGLEFSKHEKKYRDFKEIVEQNIGNKILVVEEEAAHSGPFIRQAAEGINAAPPFEPPPVITTDLKLGVIEGPLSFNIPQSDSYTSRFGFSRDLVITMSNYVRKVVNGSDWKLYDGPIDISCLLFERLGCKATDKLDWLSPRISPNGLLIYFGEDADNYFRADTHRGKTILDLSYVKAHNLLGLEAPSDFKKPYDERLVRDKIELLGELEKRLLQSNPDKSEIKPLLSKALELELHKGKWIIERTSGFTMDVPRYILGLCEKYGVEVKPS